MSMCEFMEAPFPEPCGIRKATAVSLPPARAASEHTQRAYPAMGGVPVSPQVRTFQKLQQLELCDVPEGIRHFQMASPNLTWTL